MNPEFCMTKLFEVIEGQEIAWALHTTMNLELRYVAALLTMQQGKNPSCAEDVAAVLKEGVDAAIFYDLTKTTGDDEEFGGQRITGKGSVDSRIPLSKTYGYLHGVHADGQTFHAKVSMVCVKNGDKEQYRFAVFSKNLTYGSPNLREVAVLLNMELPEKPFETTKSGTQLQEFFRKLYDAKDGETEQSRGQKWLAKHNLHSEGDLFERLGGAKLTLCEPAMDGREVEIYFGGCGLKPPLYEAMNFPGCTKNSVVLTPPAFLRGSENAKAHFKGKPILYDTESPLASHAKLYLLEQKDKETDKMKHSLWLGSANATPHGIGYDFVNGASKTDSVECLVRLDLEKEEFDAAKGELTGEYKLFEDFSQPGSFQRNPDFWGDFLSRYGKVTKMEYRRNNDGKMSVMKRPSEKSKILQILYTIHLNGDGQTTWAALKKKPDTKLSEPCRVQPMEYDWYVSNSPLDMNDQGDLVLEFWKNDGKMTEFRCAPCKGLLGVGSAGVLLPISDAIPGRPKDEDGTDGERVDYLARVWECEDEVAACTYLQNQYELLENNPAKEKEQEDVQQLIEIFKHAANSTGSPALSSGAAGTTGTAIALPAGLSQTPSGSPGSARAKAMAFQSLGASRLDTLLDKQSRVFLADEVGLGKTFTAAITMCLRAYKQWGQQGLGNETPFYTLYVGPNKGVLAKCCEDILKKFKDLKEGNYHITQGVALEQKNCERLSELWNELGEEPGTTGQGKKIVLVSASVNLMGERSVVQEEEEKALADIAKKNKDELEKELKNLADDDQIKAAKQKTLENYEKVLNEANHNKRERETFATDARTLQCQYINRMREDVECTVLRHFGLVIMDEYHRYFKKLKSSLSSVFYAEKTYGTKLLFVSATPYCAYKPKNTGKTEVEEDAALEDLPEFGDFLKDLFCGGTELILETGRATVEDYTHLETEYKNSLNSLLNGGSCDDTTLAEVKDTKTAFENALCKRMVRHERTILSFSRESEEHLIMGGGGASVVGYDEPIRNMFRQQQWLKAFGGDKGVLSWGRMMPWLPSFALMHGGKSATYYQELSPDPEKEAALPAGLFLCPDMQNPDMQNPYKRLDQNQILSLPDQNVAFRDLCSLNAREEMCQLLWIPPVIGAYDVSDDSIFSKHRNYSKTIVFGEYGFLQRGGAVLMSQYADGVNRTAVAHCPDLPDKLKDVKLPFEEEGFDLEKAAKTSITGSTLDEMLKEKSADEQKNLLAALADPAVAVMRLVKDEKIAREIGAAFKKYLMKEHCRLALAAWMVSHANVPGDLSLAVLRYCAEGNLYAVLREWFTMVNPVKESDRASICHVLTREDSKRKTEFDSRIWVQTQDAYSKGQGADICCPCGFAERLTMDNHDTGASADRNSDSDKDDVYSVISNAFNSPFWPMTLFVGRGAQEGLDFHHYCLRIMHMTLPKGAVSFDQRQGRIDRFHSLLVRRRAAELMGVKTSGRQDVNAAVFEVLEDWKGKDDCPNVWKKDQIFPHWQIKEFFESDVVHYQSAHHFERVVSLLPYTKEKAEYIEVRNQLRNYRSTIGSADIPIPEEYRRDLMIDLTAKIDTP